MIFEWTFLSCQCQQSCGDFQISEGRKRVFKILIIPKHRLFTTHSECIMPICTDLWALCTVLRKKATFCTEWMAFFCAWETPPRLPVQPTVFIPLLLDAASIGLCGVYFSYIMQEKAQYHTQKRF